ncbi:transporter [Georgfuchsia toluolica]|uniref:transporter n=1 Tax=Georgfuchsia toluolica TaxID=424218 RepID=UPI001C7302CE|nr:transporter [Georgfuchsia toluolica]
MKLCVPVIVAGVLLYPCFANAGPADYVYTPTVEYGEKEIDFKLGVSHKNDTPLESAHSLGFGYGAKEWWFTELYVKYKRENNESTKFDAIEWENKFQLTETGKYPVDIGLILEIERPKDHAEGWEVKWGPLFQTEFGKIQLNGNLLFERNYRSDFQSDTQFQYQWQAKYRWLPQFEFGLQGFGEMGKWDDWSPSDERIHTAGPAIFGKIPLGDHQAIRYNAAWLMGSSDAAPDHTIRMQVEYEF